MKSLCIIGVVLVAVIVYCQISAYEESLNSRACCDGEHSLIAIDPGGKYIAIGSEYPTRFSERYKKNRYSYRGLGRVYGILEVWSLESQAVIKKIPVGGAFQEILFTPDGKYIVAAVGMDESQLRDPLYAKPSPKADSNQIVFWGIDNGIKTQTIALSNFPKGMSISSDGSILAVVVGDLTELGGMLKLFDLKTMSQVPLPSQLSSAISEQKVPLGKISFGNGKKLVISFTDASQLGGFGDCSVEYWDLDSNRRLGVDEVDVAHVRIVATSSDGKTSAIFDDHSIYLTDNHGKHISLVRNNELPSSTYRSVMAFSNDGRSIVIGGEYDCVRDMGKGVVSIWAIPEWKQVATHKLEELGSSISAVRFTPDDKHVVSSSNDGTICVWSVRQ
ncbi:MAG: hypothetical protein AAGA30_06520 [Planctomycetota bacterium]